MILPLSEETVFDLIMDEAALKQPVTIEAAQSLANLGDTLMIYISNVGFNCELDYQRCSYEQRVQIFEQWLNLQRIFYIESLTHALVQILFLNKNMACETRSLFSNEEALQYINEHKEFVDKLDKFVSSCLLYMTYQLYKKQLIDG